MLSISQLCCQLIYLIYSSFQNQAVSVEIVKNDDNDEDNEEIKQFKMSEKSSSPKMPNDLIESRQRKNIEDNNVIIKNSLVLYHKLLQVNN